MVMALNMQQLYGRVGTAASPKLLDSVATTARAAGRVQARTTQSGAGSGWLRPRYVDGDWPTTALNVRLKVPVLLKPTAWLTLVMVQVESRCSAIARSTRRRWR